MAVLTTEEAKILIEELKKYADQAALDFPNREKRKLRFEVLGEKRGHEFIINIEKKPYNPRGYTWQGRYNRDNTILLRLDINPSARHVNPGTDEVIVGSHLHIYTEEFEGRYAVPFDTENKMLPQICMEFFEQFHVIDPPHFLYKPELESHV